MTSEDIIIGSVNDPILTFDNNSIERVICDNSVDLVGNELSSDIIEFAVFYDDTDSTLRNVTYGTMIYYYSDSHLVGKYYVNEVKRTGQQRYTVYGTSLIGLIEKEQFYGGFYSADRFENVLEDILFTNGVKLSRYAVYVPQSILGNSTQGGKVYTATAKEYWKDKLHIEFVPVTPYWASSSDTSASYQIMGTTYYDVDLHVYRANSSSPVYYGIEFYYHHSYVLWWSSEPLIGNGSKFIIDFDGMTGKLNIRVDYVKYDNSSVTGTVEKSTTFSNAPYTGNDSCELGYAFGTSAYFGYQAQIRWEAYRLYNESGRLVMDAKFVIDQDNNDSYIVNAVDGTSVATDDFNSYGNIVALVGDFTRFQRDEELYQNLMYGDGVADLAIRGWIAPCTRREALHQLLFSQNISLLKTGDGKYLFLALADMETTSIDADDVYDSGQEETINGAKQINVTESSFEIPTGEAEKIFDNSTSPLPDGDYIVLFDKAPIYGTPVGSGITIKYFNCNAAIVSGRGTITGTPYIQSKNVISYTNTAVLDGADVSTSNIGLITGANSDNVMNRLKAYYSGALKKIVNAIVYNGERCGLKYLFDSSYQQGNSAFLSKISAQSSSFVRANCTFIEGYVPPKAGGYTGYVIKTYSESWTVPAEVRAQEYPTIRLNIIGKGSNGTAGSSGANGSTNSGSGLVDGGEGGAGGAGGTGGSGGKIYSITIDVTNVNKITVTNSGNNTIVSTYNNNNTLLNTYSSNSGSAVDTGFINLFTGVAYALKGVDGTKGGDGGQGGYEEYGDSGLDVVSPENGEDVGLNTGGQGFACIIRGYQSSYGPSTMYNNYGGGGGAAYGVNGKNAYLIADSGQATATTSGGDGANAGTVNQVNTTYGCGGDGGHGGGGGGGAGVRVDAYQDQYSMSYTSYSMVAGYGGTGSAGASGINGCVIVYY